MLCQTPSTSQNSGVRNGSGFDKYEFAANFNSDGNIIVGVKPCGHGTLHKYGALTNSRVSINTVKPVDDYKQGGWSALTSKGPTCMPERDQTGCPEHEFPLDNKLLRRLFVLVF